MNNDNCGGRCAAQVVEAYFQSRDARHFTPDAIFYDMARMTMARGQEEIAAMIARWYGDGDFTAVRDEPYNMIATDDRVVAEWIFHGERKEAGRSSLPDSTNPEIAVPMAAVFEVANDQIQCARLYYNPTSLA
jgi:hypothetical protein